MRCPKLHFHSKTSRASQTSNDTSQQSTAWANPTFPAQCPAARAWARRASRAATTWSSICATSITSTSPSGGRGSAPQTPWVCLTIASNDLVRPTA